MKDKVIALLIKRGHAKTTAIAMTERNLGWATEAYPQAKASFLANVCASV